MSTHTNMNTDNNNNTTGTEVEFDAEFITPPNTLKQKIGTGGLSKEVLDKAQNVIEDAVQDYPPVAAEDLKKLQAGIDELKKNDENKEKAFYEIQAASIDLKSNGAMFGYPLVSQMANSLLTYVENIKDNIKEIDNAAIEIIQGHHNSIKAVVDTRQSGEVDEGGKALVAALSDAAKRYYKKEHIEPVI